MTMDDIWTKISILVQSHMEQKKYISYGILGGDMGSVYLLCMMKKNGILSGSLDPNKYLTEIFNTLHSVPLIHSYCNGIAGLGYSMHKLQEAEYVSNVDCNLESFDNEIFKWYIHSLSKDDIDPLHGALGALYYFTIRYKYNTDMCRQVLYSWCDYLSKHLEKIGSCYSIGFRTFDKTPPYNLSLSHGLSGLIVISVEALKNIPIKNDFEIKRILRLLGKYLVHNVNIPSAGISCTPSFGESKLFSNISRLGWCYGDLGVALALYKLGNLISCSEFIDVSRQIVIHASKRRMLQETFIMDRCLCHGSCGVYVMFRYFNEYLFNGSLDNVVRYWFDYTYKDVIKFPSLYSTKFAYYDNQEHKYKLKTNLLDGISGIGLGLIPNSDVINNLIFLT